MYTFIIVLVLIVSALLVLVVLSQNSKGGASGQLSGATQMVGARQTTDLLEKITWGLLSAMFILTLSSNFFVPRSTMDDFLKDANIDKASEKRTAPATTPKPIEQKNADEKKTDEKKTEAKPAEKK